MESAVALPAATSPSEQRDVTVPPLGSRVEVVYGVDTPTGEYEPIEEYDVEVLRDEYDVDALTEEYDVDALTDEYGGDVAVAGRSSSPSPLPSRLESPGYDTSRESGTSRSRSSPRRAP